MWDLPVVFTFLDMSLEPKAPTNLSESTSAEINHLTPATFRCNAGRTQELGHIGGRRGREPVELFPKSMKMDFAPVAEEDRERGSPLVPRDEDPRQTILKFCLGHH